MMTLNNQVPIIYAFAFLYITAFVTSTPLSQKYKINSFAKHERDISGDKFRRSTSGVDLTPDTFPLPCAMAPSELKPYLEGVINSTLHPETWKYSTFITPITCAMTTTPRRLRREIFDFGRYPSKFFLNLPEDISAENYQVAMRVWESRLTIFQKFLDKMESSLARPPNPAASMLEEGISSSSSSFWSPTFPITDSNHSLAISSPSTSTTNDSAFREFLRQMATSTPPPTGNIVESSESELRMWKLIVIIAVVVVIILALVYSVAQTAKCVLSVWKGDNVQDDQFID